MTISEKYNIQKSNIFNHNNRIFQNHYNNLITANNSGNTSKSAIDNYIITIVKTKDGMRGLIDIDDLNNIYSSVKEDITDRLVNEMNDIVDEVNKRLR